jgi:uncharacterized protein (TIGR03437 family)
MRTTLALVTLLTAAASLGEAQGTVKLKGSVHPKAIQANDRGLADPASKIGYVTIVFQRTPEQQAALNALLQDQQNPASPNFHRWLTPEQFGERFGASTADIAKVSDWLKSQGLNIETTARGRDWIACSGTVAQFQRAFRTEIHRYRVDDEDHIANSTELSVPGEMSGLIQIVRGLNDFNPKPAGRLKEVHADYTNSSGFHYLAPDDWAAIYNVSKLYSLGYNGTGQRLLILGRSNFLASDIAQFRTLFGLPPSTVEMHLVGAEPGLTSSQSEATLDLEWSGAIARGATIVYDYASNLYDALQDAIDNARAPVISMSFGGCETGGLDLAYYDSIYALKANSMGITWLAASGDAGPANCDAHTATSAVNGLSASFPATIPQVTAVGGSEFNDGAGGNYWTTFNSATLSSAVGYIPEMAWNESNIPGNAGLWSSGGGPSTLYPKPAWQTGPGVPSDGARDTPDLALTAAGHDGYRVVLNGSTNSIESGTSASTPSFAGVIAILNQYLVAHNVQTTPGLANINPTLYNMWSTTPSAFHDITVGSNIVDCKIGTPNCTTGTFGFNAGPGYDLVTGVGSIDAYNLVTNWKTVTPPNNPSIVSVTATPNPVYQTAPDSNGYTYSVSIKLSETNGGQTTLTGWSINGNNFTPNIASFFGSATIPPYGTIGTTIGYKSVPAPVTYPIVLSGMDPSGKTWTQTVSVQFLPSPASAVSVSVAPNPVYQTPADSQGYQWVFSVQLTETAGVATTLTGFTNNGIIDTSSIASYFGSTSLPANGTLTAELGFKTLAVPLTETFAFTGTDASGRTWTQQASAQFLPAQTTTSAAPKITGVANGASFQTTFAPGMEMSVFGTNLANSTAIASSLPLPSTLAGATCTINGLNAPFYYASAGQLNIQIPYGIPNGSATLTLNVNGQNSPPFPFVVTSTAPGIYVGANSALVPSATATRGSIVSLYMTGTGAQTPAIATGAAPASTTPLSQLPVPAAPYSITVGGTSTTYTFFGIPPFLVGVTQVNFLVPTSVALGVQPVVVTVGGVASVAANLTITQ